MQRCRIIAFKVARLVIVGCALTLVSCNGADSASWRIASNSGVNALHLMMRLAKCDSANYEDILQSASESDSIETLFALKSLGLQFDYPLAIRTMTFEQLSELDIPVIAHTDSNIGKNAEFVLVIRVGKNRVVIADGSTCRVHQVSYEQFRRRWSGYVAVPVAANRSNVVQGVFVGLATGVAILMLWRKWARR